MIQPMGGISWYGAGVFKDGSWYSHHVFIALNYHKPVHVILGAWKMAFTCPEFFLASDGPCMVVLFDAVDANMMVFLTWSTFVKASKHDVMFGHDSEWCFPVVWQSHELIHKAVQEALGGDEYGIKWHYGYLHSDLILLEIMSDMNCAQVAVSDCSSGYCRLHIGGSHMVCNNGVIVVRGMPVPFAVKVIPCSSWAEHVLDDLVIGCEMTQPGYDLILHIFYGAWPELGWWGDSRVLWLG